LSSGELWDVLGCATPWCCIIVVVEFLLLVIIVSIAVFVLVADVQSCSPAFTYLAPGFRLSPAEISSMLASRHGCELRSAGK
jgi:hypothetical protein